jgi:PhnB protein
VRSDAHTTNEEIQMKAANPYLNFAGDTEEAFEFYRTVFGGEFIAVLRFRDFGAEPMGIPERDQDRIAHIALPLGPNNMLMGTDIVGDQPALRLGNNSYITLEAESAEEAERLFDGLSAGGTVAMPLQRTQWAEKYGICSDRYGVQWMVDYTGGVRFDGSGS